jgi:hypothetical protein
MCAAVNMLRGRLRRVLRTAQQVLRAAIPCLTGKSVNRLSSGCPVPFEKIFCFSEIANHVIFAAIPLHSEGRFAIVT